MNYEKLRVNFNIHNIGVIQGSGQEERLSNDCGVKNKRREMLRDVCDFTRDSRERTADIKIRGDAL